MGRRPKTSVLLWVASLAIGLASGVSVASECDGWYCDDSVSGCTITPYRMVDLCCRDEDGNQVYHCVTCDRYEYDCPGVSTYGPGTNCRNPGDVCQ